MIDVRELRRVVMDRLIDQVPALVGRVYDKAVEGTAYPYASLGPSYGTAASVECIRARNVTLQIDIWDDTNKGVVEDIVSAVDMALDGWRAPDRLTSGPVRVSLIRVMDDATAVHGVVQIEAGVEG
ncbi:DUF3168 domain-containing protein [Falsirhodobacter halotolerans]|uniref:DUF3168 domain-containing protein n=1 Tax=Falsirhodobacter halotolerans TaxID=1146892 RepID=UPI001FD389F9|nr:DUF3168 domain-containing protein [Falsirhodobacter halotolerans]MCJ8138603.1 DUF3168 domain-containing protein [Falsirhodobacter halotolerans]